LRIAAVIIALGVLVFLAQQYIGPEPSFRTVTTQQGERASLSLADGTVIELNVDSQLRLPEAFASSRREVWLTGEAFFDVTPEADRPFLIHTGDAIVEVLGTTFTVAAYANEAHVAVIVQEGRVALRSATVPDTTALLTPGERGQLSADYHLTVDLVDPDVHLAWRNGRLIFEGTSLAEVARTLSRWYDVDVQIEDDVLAALRLDASFEEEPLADVLATIAVALPIDYHVEDRTITFTRP
jgi:ferric-dicitrate binding protein FerR (iron transport regulator)